MVNLTSIWNHLVGGGQLPPCVPPSATPLAPISFVNAQFLVEELQATFLILKLSDSPLKISLPLVNITIVHGSLRGGKKLFDKKIFCTTKWCLKLLWEILGFRRFKT